VPVSFHDPRSVVVPTSTTYSSLVSPPAAAAPCIGLLANGFPDSAAFLAALSTHIRHRLTGASFRVVTKLSPPTPLTRAELRTLTEGCDAVIAAYGH
jgi:Ni,Fe-hydrogenase I small subunit